MVFGRWRGDVGEGTGDRWEMDRCRKGKWPNVLPLSPTSQNVSLQQYQGWRHMAFCDISYLTHNIYLWTMVLFFLTSKHRKLWVWLTITHLGLTESQSVEDLYGHPSDPFLIAGMLMSSLKSGSQPQAYSSWDWRPLYSKHSIHFEIHIVVEHVLPIPRHLPMLSTWVLKLCFLK